MKDFNPKILELKQPLKKIVQYGVAGLILFLNIINIYNSWKENNDLIDTAKSSLDKIEHSATKISKVDSVLNEVKNDIQNQVGLLDSAIGKSQELIRLEQLDFDSKRAELGITDLNLIIDPIDSTKLKIQSRILNTGRKAVLNYSVIAHFTIDEKGMKSNLYQIEDKKQRRWTKLEIESNYRMIFEAVGVPKIELMNENSKLVIIISLVYEDYVTKKNYKEVIFQEIKLPYSDKNNIVFMSPDDIRMVKEILKKNKMFEIVYPEKYY
ncbi:hypothetical protein [Flagellimonas sp.]|uniref:hypothetical protein n=1 Tax=Flagellimonas sp. TaxID=2058762 RepID=UPI003BABC100